MGFLSSNLMVAMKSLRGCRYIHNRLALMQSKLAGKNVPLFRIHFQMILYHKKLSIYPLLILTTSIENG